MFPVGERRKLRLFLLLQLSLTILDIVGILLFAIIAAVGSLAVQNGIPSQSLKTFLDFLSLSDKSPQFIVSTITLIATSMLVFKSVASLYLNKRSLGFLSIREAFISSEITRRILNQNLDDLEDVSTVQYQNVITLGAGAVTTGFVSQTSSLIAEIFLQFSLLSLVFFFSPLISLVLFIYFSVIFLVTTNRMGKRSKVVSQAIAYENMTTARILFDAIDNYRFVITSGSRDTFVSGIRNSRKRLSSVLVEQQLLSVWSKYFFEIALLLGVIGFSAYAFLIYSATKAASLIAVFLATAYRFVPSLAKVQGLIVQIKGSIGSATLFFEVYEKLKLREEANRESVSSQKTLSGELLHETNYAVIFDNVSFKYKSSDRFVLNELSFVIPQGQKCGLVGPSGSGKSTLVDLIIGAVTPNSGNVLVGVENMHNVGKRKKTKIGYVPQEVKLLPTTITQNVAFGIPKESIDIDLVQKLLLDVGLSSWVEAMPFGYDTNLGEYASRISGGQAQRLGIARALYTSPDLLILDESTSSLDAESEQKIMRIVESLNAATTLLTIAHRLSTIKNVERLLYLDNGQIIADGTFETLREKVPQFDRNLRLLDIN